jgi:hypothetical protein
VGGGTEFENASSFKYSLTEYFSKCNSKDIYISSILIPLSFKTSQVKISLPNPAFTTPTPV